MTSKLGSDDLKLIAIVSGVLIVCVGVFFLSSEIQDMLKASHSIFNPIAYITASFVHGDVLHLGSNLFAFVLFAFLLYFINKKTNQQQFFFYSLLTIFILLPVLDYGILFYYGIYKSIPFGFGLSLVDSGLIGLTVPSLILFFKNRLEKFNSLLFFVSFLLFTFGLTLLPYAFSSQFSLLFLIFILGFVFGVFEYRRILNHFANSYKQRKARMGVFLESYLVLFAMFFYFFSIVGLFPSSILTQGGITDIMSHYIGLLFGSVIFSFYAFYIPSKRKSQTLKQIRVGMWELLLEPAGWGRRYRGDFIAGAIAFLIPFLTGLIIQGLTNVITFLSLFGLIIVLLPIIFSNENCYHLLLQRFIIAKFQHPIKIGVLDGYLRKERRGNLPGHPYTEYETQDWYGAFSSETEFKVDWISAAEISNKYEIIINPFGEMYPEIDKPNLLTLRKIVNYVRNGGVFINVAGLAFYYLWDGEKQDLTGPLYETYQINQIPGVLQRITLLRVSYLLDSWLYRQFGIRTTFFTEKIIPVHPISDEYFKDLDKVGNQPQVLEFRSAFRSEKDRAKLIPLLKGEYNIPVSDKEELSFECYPIAAVGYGKGYLILNGMKLEKARSQDFEKVVEAIRRIAKKLHSKGIL